jgi:hypothetical protein
MVLVLAIERASLSTIASRSTSDKKRWKTWIGDPTGSKSATSKNARLVPSASLLSVIHRFSLMTIGAMIVSLDRYPLGILPTDDFQLVSRKYTIEERIMKDTKSDTHEGKVVSVTGNKVASTCSQGKEHHHTLTKDAKVTCDGKESKLADLKAGTPIRVTQCKDDRSKASSVESGKHLAAAH